MNDPEDRLNCPKCEIPMVKDGKHWYCISCEEEY